MRRPAPKANAPASRERGGGRAIAPARRVEILRRIAEAGAVAVAETAAALGVAQETIRRDLKSLAAQGKVSIAHGGATAPALAEPPLARRMAQNAAGKAAIGRLAKSLARAGETAFLDSGATGAAIAVALAARADLTFLTASLPIARILLEGGEGRVIFLGGEIDRADGAVVYPPIEALDPYRIDLAFIGAGGLGVDGEITDFTTAGARFRAALLERARRGFIAIDSSKFGQATPIRLPLSTPIAGLLFDRAPPAPIGRALKRRGLPVLAAEKRGPGRD